MSKPANRDELRKVIISMWWAASDYYHSPDFKPRTDEKLLTYQNNMADKIMSTIEEFYGKSPDTFKGETMEDNK